MTEFFGKSPIASFKTDHDDGIMRVSEVIEARVLGVPSAERMFVANVSQESSNEKETLAALALRTNENGTREITGTWEVGSKEKAVSPRVLAMLAETAFHEADLRGDKGIVKVRVPRDSELPRLYAHTLGMRPVYISEGETDVTLRANVRVVRGSAAEALRTAATRRLRKSETIQPKEWNDEAA